MSLFTCTFLSHKIKKIFLIYLFVLFFAVLGLHCCTGFSLVVGFSLRCLLLLWSTGSAVVGCALSGSKARGICLDQGLNPCLLH